MHHQIAQVLRRRIEAEEFGAGAKLATEQALCEEFGVSRTTVRHALGQLKQEGLLRSRRGVGTQRAAVTFRKKKYVRSCGDPLHAELSSKPKVVFLGKVDPPDAVRKFLGLPAGDQALRVVRVHDLDGEPLSVVVTYLPAFVADGVTRAALRTSVSLHEILWSRYGLRQKKSLHAIRVARADKDVAELLKIGLAEPVLNIQASTYLEDGAPIRWTENYFREDRYEYTAEFLWDKPARRRQP
jgi:GntR family transcriptional regulator